MPILLLFLLCSGWVLPIVAISCNDILREGSVKEFSKDELATLSSSSPQQLETCLFILGKNELDKSKAQILWETIKEVYGSVSDIPEENLKQLGWVISGIPVADFYNVTVTDIDTVAILGLYRNLSNYQLTALKQTIDNQWSRKTPEQLTSYDLMALRQILCAFNDSDLAAIHPDSYRDAAGELSTLRNCPKPALTQLVNLAINDAAFGDPAKWNSIQVATIGCIMAGLPTASDIPPESMEGITPDIIYCLPPGFLQTMTLKQMQHLTTNAASSISSTQRDYLSSDQKDALDQAITGLKYTKPSPSSKPGDVYISIVDFFCRLKRPPLMKIRPCNMSQLTREFTLIQVPSVIVTRVAVFTYQPTPKKQRS